MVPSPFTLKVPASSANIGPGFDVLGIGLNLYLEIDVRIDPSVDTSEDSFHGRLSYEGEGKEGVPLDTGKNLVTQTALYVMRCNGFEKFPMGTHIHVKNPIPLGRGLGSSGAAIVGGVMLGNEICQLGFDKIRLLDYCLLIERHPDNIAAAMLGGFVGSYLNELTTKETNDKSVPLEYILPKDSTPEEKIVSTAPPKDIGEYLKYNWNHKIKCVAIIPQFEVKTDDARAVLPDSYTRSDIVFNLQRLAVLTSCLGQDPPNSKLIYNSMKDKVHQPYRASLIPGLTEVLQNITPSSVPGVCGICLSGAGPTILCLATENFNTIAETIIDVFKSSNVNCQWKLLDLAYDGATVREYTLSNRISVIHLETIMENISINHVDLQTKIIAQDILDKSSSQPIYLSSVEVVGGETFSNVFFKKLLSPLLETSDYTFGKLVSNVEASYNKLKDTEVFTDIGVSFSTDFTSGIPSNVKNYNSKTDKPIPTKVKFDVKSINLNIGEYFLNLDNDTPLNVNLHYLNNNFNSNAELINVGVDYNPYKPNQHLVTNGKLISNLTNPRFKFVIDLFNTNQNNKIWQKSSENSLGGVIGLQYNNTSRNLHFLTGLSILKRKLHDMDDSTIDDVKLFAGDNIKSSIINELSYSNLSFLNSATNNFPVNGFNFLLSNELSSNQQLNDPSSDSGYFCKSSFTSNIFKTFANNYLTLKISNSFGSIYNPLLEELSPVHVSDRFYLGGSKSFKGYSKNSINANGGNQFYKLDSSLFLKLPHFLYSPKHNQNNEANPLRLYVNGIAGNVSDNLLDDSSLSTSVGFGLKYFNNWAHFDLGYYLSKKINNVDQLGVKDGLQFSLSVGGSNRSSF